VASTNGVSFSLSDSNEENDTLASSIGSLPGAIKGAPLSPPWPFDSFVSIFPSSPIQFYPLLPFACLITAASMPDIYRLDC
jgi:hypothetical protein